MKKWLKFFFVFIGLLCTFNHFTVSQDIKRGYSMLEAWPLYTPPPYVYQDNEIISIMLNTSPEALKSLVPEPLSPNPMGLMVFYIGRFNIIKPITYNYLEAGIVIPAIFNKKMGSYVVIMYLDKALPIIPGREIFGFPKKDADITITRDNGKISGKVERDGVSIINVTFDITEKLEKIPPQPKIPWYNLKIFPSIIKDAPPDIKQLVLIPSMSETKELYSGSGNLKFQSTNLDPLGEIPIIEITKSEYSISSLVLDYGEILYNYLTNANLGDTN